MEASAGYLEESEYCLMMLMIIFGLLIEQGNTREQGWTSHQEGQERIPTHKVGQSIQHLQISYVGSLGVCVLEWRVATVKLGSRMK